MGHRLSKRFAEALTRDHTIVAKCEILSPSGAVIDELSVKTGFVNADSDADVRRKGYVTLVGYKDEITPAEAADLLHPLSHNELKLYRGIRYYDGDEEFVPLGILGISRVEVGDTGESLDIRVEGSDRGRRIQRARFISNYNIPRGSNYADAIREMISSKVPGLLYNFAAVEAVTPALTWGGAGETGGGNAWDAGLRMAEAIGHELFIDAEGVVTLQPVPGFHNTNPMWDYHGDDDDGIMLYVNKMIDDEDTFNHVVVFGESTDLDEPVRAEAVDDDPTSPTYINGPMGSVPTFFRSNLITSVEQAQLMADAQLRSKLGVLENVRIISIVNPSHHPGDVIHIRRERAKVDALYIIRNLTIPLEPIQALNIVARSRRVA